MLNQGEYIIQHDTKARLAARKAGIKIQKPHPHLPVTEQEETDTM